MSEFLLDWQAVDEFSEEADAGGFCFFVEDVYGTECGYTITLSLPDNEWHVVVQRGFADNRDAAKYLCEEFAVQMASDLSPVANRAIRANIGARGYLEPWTDEQVVAINIGAKLIEELAEACEHLRLPRGLAEAVQDVGELARSYFDERRAWKGAGVTDMEAFLAELADVQVVLSTALATLQHNAVEGALKKSADDIGRGVR
jgi:hypothetical protein